MDFTQGGLATVHAVGVAWSLLPPLESLFIPTCTYDMNWKRQRTGEERNFKLASKRKGLECFLWVIQEGKRSGAPKI